MWPIIIIFILVLVYIFFQSPKGKGMVGEFRIQRKLKKLTLKIGGIAIHDMMFEDDVSSSQIDHILMTQKAIYVIETKNYNGYVFGNEKNQNWTVTIKHVNRKKSKSGHRYKKTHVSKHQFYNPIKQNNTHINKLLRLTDIHTIMPIYNIVVFGRKAKLKDVSCHHPNYVLHESELNKVLQRIDHQLKKRVSTERQVDVIDQLYYHNIKRYKKRRQHVKRVKKKYH